MSDDQQPIDQPQLDHLMTLFSQFSNFDGFKGNEAAFEAALLRYNTDNDFRGICSEIFFRQSDNIAPESIVGEPDLSIGRVIDFLSTNPGLKQQEIGVRLFGLEDKQGNTPRSIIEKCFKSLVFLNEIYPNCNEDLYIGKHYKFDSGVEKTIYWNLERLALGNLVFEGDLAMFLNLPIPLTRKSDSDSIGYLKDEIESALNLKSVVIKPENRIRQMISDYYALDFVDSDGAITARPKSLRFRKTAVDFIEPYQRTGRAFFRDYLHFFNKLLNGVRGTKLEAIEQNLAYHFNHWSTNNCEEALAYEHTDQRGYVIKVYGKLKALGLSTMTITKLLNANCLCVTNYGHKPLNAEDGNIVRVLRQGANQSMVGVNQYYREFVRAEDSARILEGLITTETDLRDTLIKLSGEEIARPNLVDIAEGLGISTNSLVTYRSAHRFFTETNGANLEDVENYILRNLAAGMSYDAIASDMKKNLSNPPKDLDQHVQVIVRPYLNPYRVWRTHEISNAELRYVGSLVNTRQLSVHFDQAQLEILELANKGYNFEDIAAELIKKGLLNPGSNIVDPVEKIRGTAKQLGLYDEASSNDEA